MNERALFFAALDIDGPAARAAFLTEACGGDTGLLQRVKELLQTHERAGSFLERPAVQDTRLDTSPADAPPDGPGSRLGPYRLVRQLGEGGMGTVYLAEQTEPVRRQVALKVVKRGMDSKQVLARFDAERQALALMDHPHIAKVLDAGTTATNQPFFVMELVKGLPINEYCDQHKLGIPERLMLFVPVCQAVQHAHQKGIIHRDLKPSNILVQSHDGRPAPRVIDFGLAKAMSGQPLTEHTLLTGLGHVAGTPLYMAPEQAASDAIDVDTRADIYALGVLLYELLTGTTPFEREDLSEKALDEILRIIRDSEPPTPSQRLGLSGSKPGVAAARGTEPAKLGRFLKGDLDWIVMKALAKERDRRYETANALAEDVGRFLNHKPVSAGPPSRRYRFRKFAGRHRATLAIASAFAALLVAGTAVSTRQAVRATAAERESDGQRAEAAEEAAVARAALSFLNEDILGQASAFGQAGPDRAPNRDLKVRTALDRAAASVPGKFAGRPRVEAAVRAALGGAYRDLGEYGPARAQLTEAVRLARDAIGEDHPDTLGATNGLAVVLLYQRQYDDAEALFARTLDGCRRRCGEEHEETLRAQANLAAVAQGRGDLDRAESLLTEVLEVQRRALGEEHHLTLASSGNLALLHQARGRFHEADRLLTAGLEASRRTLGDEHPRTLSYRNNLAALHQAEGKHEQALPILRDVLEVRRRVLGDEHDDTCTARNNLAACYDELGQLDEAEPLYVQNLQIQRRQLGDDHLHTLITMSNLATLYLARGEYARAEPLKAQALGALRRTAAAGSRDFLRALNNLAVAYYLQRKYAEAEPLYVEALAGCRKVLGEEHPHTLMVTKSLAALYRDWGKDDQAEPLFERVRAALARQPGGAESPQTASVLVSLGLIRLRRQKADEAEPLLREALRIYEKQAPEAWYRFDAQSRLGECLAARARYAEAEPLLLAGYEGLRRRAGEVPPGGNSLAEAGGRVVRLYEAWGQPEEGMGAPETTPAQVFGAAGVLAQAASNVKGSGAEAAATRERYAARSLDLLRRAQAKGFFKGPASRQAFRTNSDFAGLRDRQDFKKLLADLD
jgi:serine/threonine protein kinase/tetratricopeptide (TPR) repeat protein